MKPLEMNETLRLGITLMIISLVAGIALALANYYTAPIISMKKEIAIKESLNKVIKAESFQEKDGYYEAYDKEGKLIGKVVKVAVPGYSSIIHALVGIDLGNKITGVDIISQAETPGLGTNIEKESFLQQFIGKKTDVIKIKKDNGQIDAITGATISSRAITEGIRKSIEERLTEIEGIKEVDGLNKGVEELKEELNESTLEIDENIEEALVENATKQ